MTKPQQQHPVAAAKPGECRLSDDITADPNLERPTFSEAGLFADRAFRLGRFQGAREVSDVLAGAADLEAARLGAEARCDELAEEAVSLRGDGPSEVIAPARRVLGGSQSSTWAAPPCGRWPLGADVTVAVAKARPGDPVVQTRGEEARVAVLGTADDGWTTVGIAVSASMPLMRLSAQRDRGLYGGAL